MEKPNEPSAAPTTGARRQSKARQVAGLLTGKPGDGAAPEKPGPGEAKAAAPQATGGASPLRTEPKAPSAHAEPGAGRSEGGKDAPSGSQDAQGATPAAGEGGEPTGESGARREALKSLKDAAEALGVEPAALYELEIPLGGGKVATLGAVKDWINAHGLEVLDVASEFSRTQAAREEAEGLREQASGQAMALRRELVGVMAAMGKVPPAAIEAARSAQRLRVEREMALALDAVPEWKDPRRFEQDREEMVGLLKPYGFTKAEFDAVDDSRLLLFLRDAVKRRRVAQSALNAARSEQAAPERGARPSASPSARSAAPGNSQRGAAIVRAAKSGRMTKVHAVSALLTRK